MTRTITTVGATVKSRTTTASSFVGLLLISRRAGLSRRRFRVEGNHAGGFFGNLFAQRGWF